MRSLRVKLAIGVAALGVVVIAAAAVAGDRGEQLRTTLTGYEEVPAISTAGDGRVQGRAQPRRHEIRYDAALRRTSSGAPADAGAHPLRQRSVNGGIVGLAVRAARPTRPAGTQACPAAAAAR